ncbi:MAG: aldehyde dehydrogenase [Acidobacteria bacterium]|nr:MAG: aldehyde dehydrogenase [Acidobacteriota bacterium]
MSPEDRNLVQILNHLIEVCKNGEKGYREAAEEISSPYFQMRLMEYANQRNNFAKKLQGIVRSLGGNPGRRGTVKGALHRGWMNIKHSIIDKDDLIILECGRGEDLARRYYEDALGRNLPDEVRLVVERQYQNIQQACDRIHTIYSSE